MYSYPPNKEIMEKNKPIKELLEWRGPLQLVKQDLYEVKEIAE